MFKSTKEFDSVMKDILVQIRDGIAVNSLSSSIDEGDFNAALAECVDRRYLSGLSYQRTMDGKPHFSLSDVRVTYSGLTFIESH